MGSFIDNIILLGIGQGFFLIVALHIMRNSNRKANIILEILIGSACLMLLARIATLRMPSPWIWQWVNIADSLLFLIGPLGYVYIRRLLIHEQSSYILPWYHAIPVVIHLIFVGYILQFHSETYIELAQKGAFTSAFKIIEIAAMLLIFGYWYASWQLLNAIIKTEKNELSFKQAIVPFTRLALLGVLGFLVLWSISFIMLSFFKIRFPIINYNIVWISISILIYIVGFYALSQPNIFKISISKKTKQNLNVERLSNADALILREKLETCMKEERMYLKNELTLDDISKKLQTSSNNLSWLLNNVYKQSFYDYINRLRLQAFIEKVHNKEYVNRTLLSLSMDVGFNSKSTFNKAFKATFKNTPSNYIKNLEESKEETLI